MGEHTDLEPIAIALYESDVRANQGPRAKSWIDLTHEVRDKWRKKAKEMTNEAVLGIWNSDF